MNDDDCPTEPSQLAKANRSGRHPLFGALKGVTSIPPGVDLTEPADPRLGRSVRSTRATLTRYSAAVTVPSDVLLPLP